MAREMSIGKTCFQWLPPSRLLFIPNRLDGLFLVISERTSLALRIGSIDVVGFIGATDASQSRHLEVAVRVIVLQPIPSIL